jgi:hypothetical protein
MSLVEVNWKPDERALRLFSRVGAAALALAGAGIAVRSRAWSAVDPAAGWRLPLLLLAAAAAVALLGAVLPRAIRPLYLAVTGVAWPLGFAVSNLLVLATFFLVLTPVGIAMRLVGRDPLGLHRRGAGPAWIPREAARTAKRYLRQY